MKRYWIYFLCVLLGVHANQYEIYSSPCPHLFSYHREGYEWVGLAQVSSSPLGKTMKFEVILSLRTSVKFLHLSSPSVKLNYLGAIELYDTRDDAIQQIRFNQTVRYRIRFPSQNPLPKLVKISVNGVVLCLGPPATGLYITMITLEHTLFTELAAMKVLNGVDNNVHHQDPLVTYSINDNDETSNQQSTPPEEESQHLLTPNTTATYDQSTDGSQCGTPHEKNNFRHLVIGGDSVRRGAWPWLVAVYLRRARGLSFNCGGNLISSRTVVTAAHCLRTSERTYQPDEVMLYLGRNNIHDQKEAGVVVSQAKRIHIHSDFMSKDTSYDADIALIIMRKRADFTEFIRPICLCDAADSLSSIEGRLGTVIGWGRDGSGKILTSEPKKIKIPVVSETECLRSSDTYRYITSQRTFCAGARDGTGPCNGDSGGGMSFKINNKWVLRGIVSAALADPIENHCNLGEYVVFTDVAKFVTWIKSHIR